MECIWFDRITGKDRVDIIPKTSQEIGFRNHSIQVDGVRKLTPCYPGDGGAMEMMWNDFTGNQLVLPDVAYKDFVRAVKRARPTVNAADNQRHIQFTEDFGSEGR